MRVVLVCPYSWTAPGGVAHHIDNLAQRLRKRGHEVRIIAPADGPVEPGVIGVGRSVGVRYNGAVARIAFGPRVSARVRIALRRAAPDVVHVHEPFVPSVSMIAASAARVPLVLTYHAAAADSRAAKAFGPLLRTITRKADVRIAVSAEARRTAASAERHPMRIVPNGIDLERFADIPARDPATETVLFFGRLDPRKGARVLCEAFGAIKRLHPPARLVIGGDGPDRQACERAIPADLRDDVEFLGRVSPEAVAAVLGNAAVVVLPALGGESFGIVLLEAMAAGRPVVATSIPGYAAVARDGREALLVPPGDHDALAIAVARVLREPALGDALVEAGRARAAEFDWDRVVVDVEKAYLDAIAARGTRPAPRD